MSCLVSQGVVFCQLGYLGATFAFAAVVFALAFAYLLGRWHGCFGNA